MIGIDSCPACGAPVHDATPDGAEEAVLQPLVNLVDVERRVRFAESSPLFDCSRGCVSLRDVRLLLEMVRSLQVLLASSRHHAEVEEQRNVELVARVHGLERERHRWNLRERG